MKLVIGSTLLLCALGLLFVFESSVAEGLANFNNQYHFLTLQLIRAGIGGIVLITALFLPPTIWKKTALLWYIGGIALLIAVFIPGLGREFNGARRWISLGGVGVFQPIEFVKLSIVLFFANWMSKHQRLGPFLLLSLFPVGLVLLQPDLGSSLLLFGIAFGMYYLAGGDIRLLSLIGIVGVIAVGLIIAVSPYRRDRVTTFLNPELDPLGTSFHIRQITLALGRGGWFGQGIGNSKQKLDYIPEASSDSIFAITAEEIGFLGASLIITLYLLYLYGGTKIATHHKPGSFEYLLAGGIVLWIGLQTFLNLAAVVALIPLTGMPLPFFSYGGSSLVMVLLATGILLSLRKS